MSYDVEQSVRHAQGGVMRPIGIRDRLFFVDRAMPQPPSSRFKQGVLRELTFSADVLVDKPEMAILITRIFGLWSAIEHELRLMLIRLLKADDGPATAIYDILTSESLQRAALNAAARSTLDDEGFEIFSVVLSIATTAGKLRHKLAHWRWGSCDELPGDLLLIDPKDWKRLQKNTFRMKGAGCRFRDDVIDPQEFLKKFQFDYDLVLIYTMKELEEHRAYMAEAYTVMFWYIQYLNPIFSDEWIKATNDAALAQRQEVTKHEQGTSAAALDQLSNLNLFREARDRLR